MTYWIQVYSQQTWHEFLESGAAVTGFRTKRWGVVQKIRSGDRLLCYLSKLGRFVGILAVESQPYMDAHEVIFKDEVFPCRVGVRVIVQLIPSQAVPIISLTGLSIIQGPRWGTRLMASPIRVSPDDASVIVRGIESASREATS